MIASALALALALATVAAPDACDGGVACAPADVVLRGAWISAGELMRLKGSDPRLKVIDVRTEAAYEGYHVADALNLTPLALKAKRIWREDPVVLVGSGAAYGALQQLREELLEAGFVNVSVLDGGTAYWQDAVERTEARPRMVEATGFDLVRDRSRWVILDFASAPPSILPTAQRIALKASSPAEAAQASKSSLAAAAREIRNVLVVADDDADASAIAAELGLVQRHNLFVLRGGWAAWDRQQRIAQTLANRNDNDALEAQCW